MNKGGFKIKRIKVKQIFQQFLIAVVVFSLICPGSMWAKKEKPGAYLIITKIDGQQVKGELMRVEDDSSLLLVSETQESVAKVSVSIDEIENIKVQRKSKAWKGAKIGALVLGTAGCILGGTAGYRIASALDEEYQLGRATIIGGAIVGVIGAAVGFLLGGILSGGTYYKTYEVRGRYQSEKKDILQKLRKRARFKD